MLNRNRSFIPRARFAIEAARRRPASLYLRWAIVHSLVAAALFGALWTLPYKSCSLVSTSLEQVLVPPTPDFAIGSMRWDVSAYATDPHLEPLRTYFRSVCGHQTGVAAAVALSRDFVARFPFGQAPRECFSRSYDPVEDLNEHLRGVPGHCVTRSSLATAVLLSVGIPARMVQMTTDTVTGHNTFEVWDRKDHWVMVDPTYGGVFKINNGTDGLCSAVEAQLYAGTAAWTPVAPAASDALRPASLYNPQGEDVLRHALMYPEPWLYMRTGPRISRWPYRGAFAVVGPMTWRLGPAQAILRCAIVLFTLIAAASLVLAALVRVVGNTRPAALGGAVPEAAQLS